jgi:hypothetical protein
MILRVFTHWFDSLLHPDRSDPVTLTPETQAKIDKAFADKQAAQDADATDAAAATTLTQAQAAKDASAADALAKHQTATASAHDALAAVADDLGFPLPG